MKHFYFQSTGFHFVHMLIKIQTRAFRTNATQSLPFMLSPDNSRDAWSDDLGEDLLLPCDNLPTNYPNLLDTNEPTCLDTSFPELDSPSLVGMSPTSPLVLVSPKSLPTPLGGLDSPRNLPTSPLVLDSPRNLPTSPLVLVASTNPPTSLGDLVTLQDSIPTSKDLPKRTNSPTRKLVQLERKDVAKHRDKILKEQQFKCGICEMTLLSTQAVLDHLHKRRKSDIPGVNDAGLVRGVLCDGCNRIEGKVAKSAMRFQKDSTPGVPTLLRKMADYLERPKHLLIHPTEKLVPRKPSKLQYNKLAKIIASKPIPPTLPAFNPRKVSAPLQKLFDAFNVDPYAQPKATSTTTTKTTTKTKPKATTKSTESTTPANSTATPKKRKPYSRFSYFKKRSKT